MSRAFRLKDVLIAPPKVQDKVHNTIKYCVLSVDGGGVRGIIPARILKEIEIRTGKSLHDIFDFAIGTSTGGLIAIGIGCKFDADIMIDLYQNQSKTIFPYSYLHAFKSAVGWYAPKYDRAGLDSILDKYFGDRMLADTDIPVCITTYDLTLASPKIWSSMDASKSSSDNTMLKNVAAATSAAPTYFAPAEFYDESGYQHYAVDGGMFLNNPTVLALLGIIKYLPLTKADEILVLSLGTGNIERKWDINKLKNAGTIEWIKDANVIDLMMDGNSDFANLEASLIFPNLFRLQVDLPKELGVMDNTSDYNMNELLKITEKYIEENDALLNQIANCLINQVGPSESFSAMKMVRGESQPALVDSLIPDAMIPSIDMITQF